MQNQTSLKSKKDLKVRWFLAAWEGDLLTLQSLKDTILMDEVNEKGWTALRLAAYNSKPEVVDWLLTQNADPMICDAQGETVFHECANIGNCLERLLNHVSECDLPNYAGTSPVMRCKSPENIRLFHEKGANLNRRNQVGGSLLTWSISDTNIPVLKELTKHEMIWDKECDSLFNRLKEEQASNSSRSERIFKVLDLALEIKTSHDRKKLATALPSSNQSNQPPRL